MTEVTEAKKRWYVIQAFSGYEGRVLKTLLEHIKMHNMEEYFGEILVPTEEVVEMRAGQRRKSERKFFPGYVLVQMEMNDDSWHLVKSTIEEVDYEKNRIKVSVMIFGRSTPVELDFNQVEKS